MEAISEKVSTKEEHESSKRNAALNRNAGLDLLRALAIISVLLCHAIPVFRYHIPSDQQPYFQFFYWLAGYYGVELFFVLSGFLIGGIFLKKIVRVSEPLNRRVTYGIKDFWARRWFRTLPNFILFFFVHLLLMYLLQEEIASQELLFRVFTLTQGIGYLGSDFYGVAWSLAVEEWFYLLFPLIFMTVLAVTKKREVGFIFAMLFMFFLAFGLKIIYAFRGGSLDNAENVFHYSTLYKLDSIFFGILLAYFWEKNTVRSLLLKNSKLLFYFGVIGLLATIFYAYQFVYNTQGGISLLILFYPLCSLSMLALFPAVLIWQPSKISFLKGVSYISTASYSLYLVHVPVMKIVEHLMSVYSLEQNIVVVLGAFFFIIFGSIWVSGYIYRYFELPFLKIRDRLTQ